MAKIKSEEWGAQQAEVWGDKDPDVFGRVVERIKTQEPEVLREVQRMVERQVPPHALLWYVTNSILRGVDHVDYGPPSDPENT